MRYAEANPLRAKMVERAEAWRWSSLGRGIGANGTRLELEPWPVENPSHWRALINEPLGEPELAQLRRGVDRGQPYGSERWTNRIVNRLGLESTMRDPWRPKKSKEAAKKLGRARRQ